MTFVADEEEDGEQWGVATLTSKKRLGDSSYIQYDFTLPQMDNTLPLTLGQQLDLCCLDDSGLVKKGGFHLFSRRGQKGLFSILAPRYEDRQTRVQYELGEARADFARVLEQELKVGDEVAIRPGIDTLSYRGQYLPVTDMVYIASGMGIVPILHQIKAVLPAGSSSVKMVTVIWINDDTAEFDVAFDALEEEHFKYNTKLEVSCLEDDISNYKDGTDFSNNDEIEEAVPDFRPGTMAVVSGPKGFVDKASEYLKRREYPEECLCLLP